MALVTGHIICIYMTDPRIRSAIVRWRAGAKPELKSQQLSAFIMHSNRSRGYM